MLKYLAKSETQSLILAAKLFLWFCTAKRNTQRDQISVSHGNKWICRNINVFLDLTQGKKWVVDPTSWITVNGFGIKNIQDTWLCNGVKLILTITFLQKAEFNWYELTCDSKVSQLVLILLLLWFLSNDAHMLLSVWDLSSSQEVQLLLEKAGTCLC